MKLKTIRSLNKPAFRRNNNNKLSFRKNNGNSKTDGFNISINDIEYTKKLGKSKDQKLSKLQKAPKSKKLSKSKYLPKFNIREIRPSYLNSSNRKTFNCLKLAFIKALILWHFNPKYHIWIKTDILDYVISNVLSQ